MKHDLKDILRLTSGKININVVFDIGAHKGTWTQQYMQIIPGAQFICFEGNMGLHKPNHLPLNTKWINGVLSGPNVGEVKWYSIEGTGDSYYHEDTAAYENVKPKIITPRTLDDVRKENNLPVPQLIKIDTQGSELDVLRGAKDTMRQGAQIIMLEVAVLPYNRSAPKFDDYISYMLGEGYYPVGVDEVHLSAGMFNQLDVVFMKKELKEKFLGKNDFFRWNI